MYFINILSVDIFSTKVLTSPTGDGTAIFNTWSTAPRESLVPFTVSPFRELSRSFDQNNRNYSTYNESALVQIFSAGVQSLSRQ